jgi:hypothetical protein
MNVLQRYMLPYDKNRVKEDKIDVAVAKLGDVKFA